MKVGVELEYWVVDETGQLTSADELLDAHECVTHEFVDSLLEIQVPPVEIVADLRSEMHAILASVLEAANQQDKHLVPLGTPLTAHGLPIITERGHLLERLYGDELRYAKHCAGTHVHFDKGRVTEQLNLLTALDPALALVNSSPYYDGERMASSARASVYRLGAHSRFSRYRDLWAYVDDTAEWNARVKTEYKLLRAIAHETGIDEEMFTKHFHPENAVLTPVRLRERSPTVEWRAPDTALPSQLVQLVDDVAALVSQVEEKDLIIGESGVWADQIGIPSFARLRKLSASAIVDGLNSGEVRNYLTTMGFDLSQYQPLSEQIQAGQTISIEQARKMRLEYADRLESDVARLQEDSPETSTVASEAEALE
jgi:gamma-glutamyl:cysteine ligase YbdK (ATP-grasp superfamily)